MTREEAADAIFWLIIRSDESEEGCYIVPYEIKALNMAIEALKQPEQKKGKWIDKGTYCVCSLCQHTESPQYDGVQPIPKFTPFCSMCGAKMEEEE